MTVQGTSDRHAPEVLEFAYVVVCNGAFSEPHVPNVPGVERFDGRVVHSSDVREELLSASKHAVVVGAGKSALDCATAAAERAGACTLLYRSPHWTAPQRILCRRYDHVMFTRISEAFSRPAWADSSSVPMFRTTSMN